MNLTQLPTELVATTAMLQNSRISVLSADVQQNNA